MKAFSAIKMAVALVMIGFSLLSGGCARPDHWSVFDTDLQARVPRNAAFSALVPETLQPRLAEKPVSVLPVDGTITLSVEQAVLLVLENNRDLSVRQINPVIAGTFEQIERGVYDPEFFAEFEYDRERANETSRSSGSRFAVEGNDAAAAIGIRQALPTGTTIETTIEQERSISSRSPELQSARIGLSITQSLLRGFGPAVNLVSIRQAEIGTVASCYELRGFVESLLAEVETAYWNYVLAGQEIAIYEKSLGIARQQLNEIEQRIEVGLIAPIEAPAARAEVARREQDLIEARSLLEERRLRLLRLVNPDNGGPDTGGVDDNGLDTGGRLDCRVSAVSEPRIDAEALTDLKERLQLAQQSRPDLNEARLRLKQNRLETIVTRNGLLPRLDLFIALGKTGFADTFSDSFRELDGNTHDFTAGIRLSRFLGDRAAHASDLAARASCRQAAEAVANLSQIVQLDVRLAANELERARQQIEASKVTREFEEQTARAEKEQFDVGSSTALQVAQAQRDLLVSQIAEVRAIINYRIALVKLYLAEGSLLERRGVRFAAAALDASVWRDDSE